MPQVESLSLRLALPHQTGKVRSIRNQGRDAIAQQTMRSHAYGARDWSGDSSDTSAEFRGSLGNKQ